VGLAEPRSEDTKKHDMGKEEGGRNLEKNLPLRHPRRNHEGKNTNLQEGHWGVPGTGATTVLFLLDLTKKD